MKTKKWLTKRGYWYLDVKNECYPFKELSTFVLGLTLMHDFDVSGSKFILSLIVTYAIFTVIFQFISMGWRSGK